jgi:hypothetical protein
MILYYEDEINIKPFISDRITASHVCRSPDTRALFTFYTEYLSASAECPSEPIRSLTLNKVKVCSMENMHSTNTKRTFDRPKYRTRCWLTSSYKTSGLCGFPILRFCAVITAGECNALWCEQYTRTRETTFPAHCHHFRKGHSSSFLPVIFPCTLLKSEDKTECVWGYNHMLCTACCCQPQSTQRINI